MRKTGILLMVLAGVVAAQQTEQPQQPPQQTRFVEPNYIYAQGSGFAEGSDYLIVRKLRDPNRWESYKGQHSAIVAAGQPYADIGQASVVKGGVRGGQAILAVKKTCEP